LSPHETLYEFLEQAPIACHEIDLSGAVVFVNDAECALLGLTREQMVGRQIWEFVAPEERAVSRDAVRRKLAGEQVLRSFERDYIRPDGVRLVLEIHERHICDAHARTRGMRSFLVDLTQRKRSEQALQESEKLYRHLVEHASDIIYRVDLKGRFTIFNDVAAKLLKYSVGELIGREYLDLIRPDYRATVRRFYRRQLTERLSHTYLEFPALTRDGDEVWFGQNVEIIEEHGRVAGFQAITRDITAHRRSEEMLTCAREELERRVEERTAELLREIAERRELESQMQHTQRLESLGVLAGGIAHDFNNLLAVIMGRAGLALTDLPHDSPSRSNIDEVISAAKTAAELTQQMLAYSGRGRFVVEPIHLSQLIEDAARLVSAVISKKAVLVLKLAADLPAVDADPAQIRQVIINLLTNASDAIGERGGEIRVTTTVRQLHDAEATAASLNRSLPAGTYVVLEVQDDGCGMDEATRERIFDPFFTTKFTGRGLGLAAVQGIVRGHGGGLRVESSPDRGSLFRILLPASGKAVLPAKAPAAVDAGDWRPQGAVLVVDDEPAVRALACQIIERAQIEVLPAVDGYDAVRQFEAHRDEIAAVLLDLTMPGLDGGEVFQRLRRIRPDLKVILCSGYDEQDVSLKFGAARPSGFLRKPYSPAELLQALRSAWAMASSFR